MLRRSDLPFGWLLAGTAALVAATSAITAPAYLAASNGATGSGLAALGFALSGVSFLPLAVQGVVNVRFPSGRVTSRWGRILETGLIVGTVLGLLSGIFGTRSMDVVRADSSVRTIDNPITGDSAVGHIAAGLGAAVPIVILLGLVAGLSVIRRAWTARGIERDQLRWRAFGVALALALFPLAVSEALPTVVDALDGVLFVATLVIPIVRYRLWAIDTIIRRSVTYALVTVVVAGGFAAIAAIGTAMAGERVGFVAAAAVAAVAFAPARSRSQRLVDQFFYGRRNEPYQVLSDLGRRLSAVAAPGDLLPSLVVAVSESLRLPYVAVERPTDGSVLAANGDAALSAGDGVQRWPLVHQNVTVGVLVAAPRRGEIVFDERDRAVLAALARQAGAAVHAESLTADLLDSRQRLVSTREEERRRLRRDLHDGLGPLLTGIGLNVDAARVYLAQPREAANPDALLAAAKEASAQAIADLRAIVYGLRPPALDDLGLVGAIAAHTSRLTEGTRVRVDVDAGKLAELPAAVEVVAFRVTVEAVTNVVRHSTATHCEVRLDIDTTGHLVIDVADNGAPTGPWTAGVGLHAMRERVDELGGTLVTGPTPTGGTVRVELPLPATGRPRTTA